MARHVKPSGAFRRELSGILSGRKHFRKYIGQSPGVGLVFDERVAREIQKLKKELYDIISSHSKVPFEKVERDSDRDYWMTAEEAKEYGMIDRVLIKNKK